MAKSLENFIFALLLKFDKLIQYFQIKFFILPAVLRRSV